ncbi:hypothetical protein [Hyalangium sp.]|uniref:hypothetical protein n=1 Tax=Hyalangium sp. TaxID=2028555 RepID=UPI002D633FA8|nr:hypothetical protein [Hyalangium sp.]HYH98632.1 hypothetical protein [Hyalangium sp.]
MAPEVLKGRRADARSDLYSFCASLYEALYGHLPFTGDSVAELLKAQRAGKSARSGWPPGRESSGGRTPSRPSSKEPPNGWRHTPGPEELDGIRGLHLTAGAGPPAPRARALFFAGGACSSGPGGRG